MDKNPRTATVKTPSSNFTGDVWLNPVFGGDGTSQLTCGLVRFTPGARTNWHSHPLGQTLYVISGVGRFQTKGGPVQEIRPGDVIWIPPGEKHWHGGSPTNAMTHIAMQEALDGNHATWMEPVTDAEYSVKVG